MIERESDDEGVLRFKTELAKVLSALDRGTLAGVTLAFAELGETEVHSVHMLKVVPKWWDRALLFVLNDFEERWVPWFEQYQADTLAKVVH